MKDFAQITSDSFSAIFNEFFSWLPNILAAIVIFVVGVFIAKAIGRLIAKVLEKVYLDQAAEKTGLVKVLHNVGMKVKVSTAVALLIQWFLYAIVLVLAVEVLNLPQVSRFLQSIVLYIPNVIVAVIILLVGVILSNFVQTLVEETARSAKLELAEVLGTAAKWGVVILTIMAALVQLEVAEVLVQILFAGIIFMVALAGGIAFGLAGKEGARDLLTRLGRK